MEISIINEITSGQYKLSMKERKSASVSINCYFSMRRTQEVHIETATFTVGISIHISLPRGFRIEI